jgi:uncharacterized RDD family membrane protein YckC
MPGFFRVLRAADPANRPPPASRVTRVFASLIDLGLGAVLFAVFYYFWGERTETRFQVTGCAGCLLILGYPLIWIIPEAITGATFGKLLLDLRLYSLDKRELTFGRLLQRDLVKYIDFAVFVHITGFVLTFSNPLRQSLADLVADTMVVEKTEYEKWRTGGAGDFNPGCGASTDPKARLQSPLPPPNKDTWT